MNRILLIGDPHFKVSNQLETTQFSEETYKYINDNLKKIDFVVILGDVLDTHEKIHVQPLCRAVDFIKKISEIIKVYIIIGNHDRINNNVFLTDEHPFSGLKKIKNITIVDKVLKIDHFLFVPYVPNGRFSEALSTVNFKEEETEVIFAHQEFKGCKMGAIVSETGDIWDETYPMVFSGHIHDFQQPQRNILYTGTPFQHGFGDSEDKFLVYLEIKDRKEWNIEKIRINVIKKKSIDINVSELEDYKFPENYVLKINIIGDVKTANLVLSKKSVKQKLKDYNIQYKLKNPEIKLKERNKNFTKNNFVESLEKKIKSSEEEIRKTFSEIFYN